MTSSISPLVAYTIEEFAKEEEEGAGSLAGGEDANLIPEKADVMVFGDGGATKTTLSIDLGFHLAAGLDWVGIPIPEPRAVMIVENEGPRPQFRRKVRRKLAAWPEDTPTAGRLHVLGEPWGDFTFADEAHRVGLARLIDNLDLALVIFGPITTAGMLEAGTIQETRAFQALLQDVRVRVERPVTFYSIHHEAKGGKVSGAWEGAVDTLIHVTSPRHGYTRMFIQKARWASEYQGQTLELAWTEGEGFALMEHATIDDDTVENLILEAVESSPGRAWGPVEDEVPGVRGTRRRAIRDRMLREGRLVNVGKVDGELCTLTYVQAGHPSRLFPPDHPYLEQLRPGPRDAADGP